MKYTDYCLILDGQYGVGLRRLLRHARKAWSSDLVFLYQPICDCPVEERGECRTVGALGDGATIRRINEGLHLRCGKQIKSRLPTSMLDQLAKD